MKFLLIMLLTATLAACNTSPLRTSTLSSPEILTVHNDGTMEYRDRTLNDEEVIIYPDGFGGERAAVKVYVPMKNDYYRDSIRVNRVNDEPVLSAN